MTTNFARLPDGSYLNMDHVRFLEVDANYFEEGATNFVTLARFESGHTISLETWPTEAEARSNLAAQVRQLNAPPV